MPSSRPPAPDIVAAISAWLSNSLLDRLEGATRFECRIAIRLLQTIERELTLGSAADAAEQERLSALLGQDGTAEDLSARLADKIKHGEIDATAPGLLEHLRQSSRDALRINNPKWLNTSTKGIKE